jgi:hypothetical protein
MARKTVRVDVPTSSPQDLMKLGQAIVDKDKADGDASPLDEKKIAALSAALAVAVPQDKAANDADAVAQKARQTRDQALGTADGQTAYTQGTALNVITYVRDQLLVTNEGQEEALSAYGFNVVIGSAKSPTPAPAKAKA